MLVTRVRPVRASTRRATDVLGHHLAENVLSLTGPLAIGAINGDTASATIRASITRHSCGNTEAVTISSSCCWSST